MSRSLAALLALLALLAGACGDAPQSSPPPDGTTAAVREVTSGGAALLDVRTQAEFRLRHAVDAEHVPLSDLGQGDRPDVAKDARVYVYCRTGARARKAAALLRRDGWSDVRVVGGLGDWERMGGTTETGSG
jgi:rhodanese-related sulfurtransferase